MLSWAAAPVMTVFMMSLDDVLIFQEPGRADLSQDRWKAVYLCVYLGDSGGGGGLH